MKIKLIIAVLTLFPVLLFAQITPEIMVEYVDAPDEVRIITADGEEISPVLIGDILEPGDTVVTDRSTAELRLDPNGTIIKLAAETNFKIESLQGPDADENIFDVTFGKIRAVASKRSGGERYTFKSQSAVCGVRGTVLTFFADGSVFVEQGLVQLRKVSTGQTVDVAAGFFASAASEVFGSIKPEAGKISEYLAGLDWKKLKPETVDQVGTTSDDGEDDQTDEGTEEDDEGEVAEDEEEETTGKEDVASQAEKAEKGDDGEGSEISGPGSDGSGKGGFMDALRDMFAMDIGAITIDGNTYQKAVLQPQFSIGKLGLGLYLPIIYQTDLFDPDDWYKPKGNNEWSFGTDDSFSGEDTEILLRTGDFFSDLFLKIKYVEWGAQRDPFFFKVGNLDNMTIGHGILMKDYANDNDFPAVRRIGVNTGADLGGLGFEAMVNDLAEPEIFGGRMYVRPAGEALPFAFGVSGIMDVNPAGEVTGGNDPTITGDPIFINAAVDFDFPLMESNLMTMIIFADAASFIPYYRTTTVDGVEKGLRYEAVLTGTGGLQNYGITAGIFGNVAIMDYRLEYRFYDGTFRPGFYNSTYDRLRGQLVMDLKEDLLNPTSVEATMGIYGEAGFSFLDDKLMLEAGYLWPWSRSGMSDDDFIHIQASIAEGTIPVVGIYGSVSYDRTSFVPTIVAGSSLLPLFDANTVLSGEIIYPIAPTLDIAAIVTTTVVYDANGDVVPSAANPDIPKISPSITIETRVHF